MINAGNGMGMALMSWSYTEGLGLTSKHYKDSDPPLGEHMDEYLVYYKKGSETWGTPIAPDCTILLGEEQDKNSAEAVSIEVVPNPFTDNARIVLHGIAAPGNLTWSVVDFSGARVAAGTVSGPSFLIDRQGLPAGLYMLLIAGDDGRLVAKGKMVVY